MSSAFKILLTCNLGLLVMLSISMVLPSARLIQKYTGDIGILLFFIFSVVFSFIIAYLIQKLINYQHLKLLYLILFVVYLVTFSIIYPMANTGSYGGIGSDRDDALNIGVKHLLSFEYPYYAKTYLNNPLTPLPGSLILAAPFVVLFGNSAYQNLFWLPVFFFMTRNLLKNDIKNLGLITIAIICCPLISHEVMHGSDLLSNSLFIVVAVISFCFSRHQVESKSLKIIASIFLGVAMSSRLTFLFILPLVFKSIFKRDSRMSWMMIGITLITFILLTLPFYLFDPSSFSPLSVTSGQVASRLPEFAPTWVIPFLTLLLVLWITIKFNLRKPSNLYLGCYLTLIFPVIFVTVMNIIKTGEFNLGDDGFGITGYGLMATFWGIIYWFPKVLANLNSVWRNQTKALRPSQ